MTDIYAVAGNPIEHSKSPKIHHLFAQQTQQDMLYKAQLIKLDCFAHKAKKMFEHGLKGMNVTVPFKEDAFRFADTHTERALRAGAVNTLKKMEDGSIHADNTDGIGLVTDLTINHQVGLTRQRILVVGAGGAVRGILQPILEQTPAEIVIANRTLSKAEQLAQDFSELGHLSACGFAEVEGDFDLIINGTSASLSGELPPLPLTIFKDTSVTYDMMYGKGLTVFNQWAKDQGVQKTIDGLGMLIEQAAEAFELWRTVRPETDSVKDLIRREAL